jgi:hypothetical protein
MYTVRACDDSTCRLESDMAGCCTVTLSQRDFAVNSDFSTYAEFVDLIHSSMSYFLLDDVLGSSSSLIFNGISSTRITARKIPIIQQNNAKKNTPSHQNNCKIRINTPRMPNSQFKIFNCLLYKRCG